MAPCVDYYPGCPYLRLPVLAWRSQGDSSAERPFTVATPAAGDHRGRGGAALGPRCAARLLGAGEALRAIIGATQSASLGAAGAVDLTGLRTGSRAAAWAEGRALTREQVITESMKLVEEIEHRTAAQPSGPPGG